VLIAQAGATDASDTLSHVLVHIHPIVYLAAEMAMDSDAEEGAVVEECKMGG
jgi:hypothetical protein